MQPEPEILEKKNKCHGRVREKRSGHKSTFELKCSGDCTEGKCEKRSKKDHHGTTIFWCSCDDSPGGCNIYIERKANGAERIDCFTLDCEKGTECRPVMKGWAEIEGVKLIDWVCECVLIAQPPK